MDLHHHGGTVNELELMEAMDRHPDVHRATEADEETVLREAYGDADAYGIYRGDGA